jgi:hypothetical protein
VGSVPPVTPRSRAAPRRTIAPERYRRRDLIPVDRISASIAANGNVWSPALRLRRHKSQVAADAIDVVLGRVIAATWRQRSAFGRAAVGVSAARLHSALVAQWREQRFPKPRAAGSIPAEGTEEFSKSFRGATGSVRSPPIPLHRLAAPVPPKRGVNPRARDGRVLEWCRRPRARCRAAV